jgi:hypothetical protein
VVPIAVTGASAILASYYFLYVYDHLSVKKLSFSHPFFEFP